MDAPNHTFTAFTGDRMLASGALETVLRAAKRELDGQAPAGQAVLVFEDQTGEAIDFDFRGSPEEVLARLADHPRFAVAPARRPGPGRPRLGVVCREISLLPRHWEWLERQPNGISAALRRLVDEARKREPDRGRARQARAAAGRFMTAMAGDRAGYEEASRALYARDRERLAALTGDWPTDIREHLGHLFEVAERLERGAPA